jgi:hypothetical protein
MRKTLLTLTALAGLVGAGVATSASAAPARLDTVPASELVQNVQYYHCGGPGWRHHEWERHRRWVHYHHRRWDERHHRWYW